MDFRDSKALFRKAGGSLLLLFETAENAIKAGYRRISYPAGITSET